MEINSLCDVVRETSFDIHCYLRHGHLEKIYENALVHRLRRRGLEVRQQHPLQHGLLINFGAPKLQVRKYIFNV